MPKMSAWMRTSIATKPMTTQEQLLVTGDIVTMDPAQPEVEAVAVRDVEDGFRPLQVHLEGPHRALDHEEDADVEEEWRSKPAPPQRREERPSGHPGRQAGEQGGDRHHGQRHRDRHLEHAPPVAGAVDLVQESHQAMLIADAVVVGAGWIGKLHPKWQQHYQLPRGTMLFELDVMPLLQRDVPRYREVAKFPPVRRDLAVIVDENVSVDALMGTMRQHKNPLVSDIGLFDVYRGKGIAEGKKSLAFLVLMQDTQKTLTDAEVDVAGEGLTLLHERAIHWPAAATLFVADPHFERRNTRGALPALCA